MFKMPQRCFSHCLGLPSAEQASFNHKASASNVALTQKMQQGKTVIGIKPTNVIIYLASKEGECYLLYCIFAYTHTSNLVLLVHLVYFQVATLAMQYASTKLARLTNKINHKTTQNMAKLVVSEAAVGSKTASIASSLTVYHYRPSKTKQSNLEMHTVFLSW